jgi:hypothetical protein
MKIIITFIFCFSLPLFLQAEEIHIEDLGNKVILIGKLEKPVGTLATIEGQMISEPTRGKSGQVTAAFRIEKVDGQPLQKQSIIGLIFRASEGIPSIHAQDLVQLSGYESGAFIGTPNEARDALGKDASPLDWKYEASFHVIKLQAKENSNP